MYVISCNLHINCIFGKKIKYCLYVCIFLNRVYIINQEKYNMYIISNNISISIYVMIMI